MFHHFGKAIAIVTACWLVVPGSGELAAQSNSLHQKERYLGSRVIFSSKYSISKLFIKDQGLSRACKRGRFRQIVDMQYVAIVNGRTYGAALYQRNMLYDPKRLADRDRIYLFKGQGTSNCKVYHKLR